MKDLSIIQVDKMSEVLAIINAGASRRATFETQMNEYSSRSHTVFTITVVQTGVCVCVISYLHIPVSAHFSVVVQIPVMNNDKLLVECSISWIWLVLND